MSVLNQMLRDLESRGVSAAPAARPATALPSSIAHDAGSGERSSRLRKVLWFGTAMVLTATASFWAVLEHRVIEARRGPQPLGLQQFGNAISMNQDPAAAPPALLALSDASATTATAATAASAAGATAIGAVIHSTATSPPATPATTLASIAPAREDNNHKVAAAPGDGTAASDAAAISAPRAKAVVKSTVQQTASMRDRSAAGTSSNVAAVTAPIKALPSKRRAAEPLATVTAGRATDTKASGAGVDAQAASAPIVRATETDIARAADLIARGRNSEAQVVLERVLAASPQQVAARQALAALHAEAGQRDRALAVLLDGAAIDPPHFAASAAQLQFESGDARGALATLARVPLAQRSAQHDALAAGIAFAAGLFADAVVSYERAVRAPNAPAIWWLGLGLAYEAAGQRSDARDTFTRIASATALPNDLRAFVNDKVAALAAPTDRIDRAHSEIAAGTPAR